MNEKTTYRAGRAGEEPGVTFEARSVRAAKAQASRLLEAGAFAGQVITLVEMAEAAPGGLAHTDRIWRKPAGGSWRAYGDAI